MFIQSKFDSWKVYFDAKQMLMLKKEEEEGIGLKK